ncbi:MFS transporter [Rhodothermus marinus]|jgi:MFS family permease|uniref:MFS transporter n=1 Tax=Rhodothermus marinus TaxID=29549 RepID=UPI000223DDDB|nr:MFS transporter [Rhodothermus marinus]AEN74357.1 major facilitator superfamily MFS_1 [Rhodothermus marinus SG0.5JP17-172]MBO2492437.1 MFS transporter [Rhodothermus marinus]BBM70784.1 MFS transporter [Rhodothermus marinus]
METVPVRLGLRANWQQFALLVVVNAFVGAMVGMERAILPLLAEQEFGLASRVATLSFVASFGLTKALANLLAGRLGDRIGRRRVLLAGWLAGLPVPWLLMWAPSWAWVVAANVLLGLNQGLAWSMTVIMKIDLVGPRQRGLAMGLNEAAGYLAVSLAALATGYVAATYGLRPQPFYLGVAFSAAGLLLSALFVRETQHHADLEARQHFDVSEPVPSFREAFVRTSWRDRRLFAVCQAGLVNNLNDGMAWGLFPLFFAALGYGLTQIGWLAALYPAVWGLGQLVTGALSDRIGRRPLIVGGMLLQGVSIGAMLFSEAFAWQAAAMVGLGIGTAMVYPTLLAVIGDVAHPAWRSTAVGVYRLWRDGGYVVGALLAGVLADLLSISWAIGAIAVLTLLSGMVAAAILAETRP